MAAARPPQAGAGSPVVSGAAPSRWWLLGWVLPLLVQVAHTFTVASTYHVGSFDDDANYLMAAHVLASGGWLTSVMPSGATVVANYLPGYPLLLVPVVWLFGAALWPPRLLSSALVAALYPLLWAWMRRRGLEPGPRTAVLVLLAVNSVLATYSTMVMAEAPFLVFFVAALFALDRWAARPGALNAALVVVVLAYLVWLKQAGTGLAVGLVAYLLWRRQGRRAVGVGAGTAALLAPGLLARWVGGGSVVGDRYSGEIANPSQGGLWHQVLSEAPKVAWSYLQNVLRESVLPEGSPLPSHGPLDRLMSVVGFSVPVLVVVGAVVWYRRHPHPELWMLGAYFAETLAYPFTNQRRVILVLPLVTMFYVVGAWAVGGWAVRHARASRRPLVLSAEVAGAVVLLVAPTVAGFTRNYLWPVGLASSEFAGAPAMTLLRAVGSAQQVVETDYRGTIAYFTDHRTAWTAFASTTPFGPFGNQNKGRCQVPIVRRALRRDAARFLVVGDFNGPRFMDSPCLLHLASTAATATALDIVRLLSSTHDQTSVFEFLGSGNGPADLVDWTADLVPVVPVANASGSNGSRSRPAREVVLPPNGQGDRGGTGDLAPAAGGQAQLTWYWRAPEAVTQVTVGSVTAAGPVSSVAAWLETPAGTWRLVGQAGGPVGNDGAAPYLVAKFPATTMAVAFRVTAGTASTAKVAYVNVIGPRRGRR